MMKRKKFTDYLLDKGVINEGDLEKAIAGHKKRGGSIIENIVKLGIIKEDCLIDSLCGYLSLPPVRVSNFSISPEVISLIPEKTARSYQVVPVSKIGNTLTLAMADPLNVMIIDDIRKITKCEVNPVVTSFSEIRDAISKNYIKASGESIEEVIKGQDASGITFIRRQDAEGTGAEASLRLLEEAPVIKFTNSFLASAVQEKASDVLIEPLENSARIRLRLDGVLQQVETFPRKMLSFIVSRIKVMCNLNIAEHRLPQEGRFRGKFHNRNVDFRVSILPSSMGEKVAIRVLDKGAAVLNLDMLGFEDDVLRQMKEDSLKSHGMLLTCGPTGAGKTTTLYSIINHIYAPEKNIVTVEDPIEYQLRGINQVSVNAAIGLTFASALRSILRQDPDIIMIGEIRDSDTADMAVKSSLTGHLVLSTLHTTTSAGSVTRLINMDVEPFLLSSTLIGVLTQRLVRKLCPKCRLQADVSDSLREKYGIRSSVALYRAADGCDACQKTGYKGRLSLCEYLRVNSEMRRLINSNPSEGLIKRKARDMGMRTLREDGVVKVEKGLTSIEEVLRVTNADEEPDHK